MNICAESFYQWVWLIVQECTRAASTALLLYWVLGVSAPYQRRSPRLRPTEVEHELLLRKRLSTLNWKMLANKARALYYTKFIYSSKRPLMGGSLRDFKEIYPAEFEVREGGSHSPGPE